MTDKHCESVNECANGELCAMLKNSVGLTLVGCSHFKPKQPQTNFDRITQSPESLAEWVTDLESFDFCIHCCPKYYEECDSTMCKEMMVEWLKQESDTE